MANLLEMLVRGQAGPGTPPLAAGLLGPPEPPRPPSLLDGGGPSGPQRPPSPAGPQPAAAPGVGAAAGVGPGAGGQPPPAAPEQPAGPSPEFRQFQGLVSGWLDRVTGGNPPAGAERWVREVTKDAASATAGKRGKTGFVGKLFGLDRVPGLTEDQSKRLRSAGLVNVGLSLMGAPNGVSTWQALGQGILAARMDAAETAGELMDLRNAQQEIERRSEIFNNPDLSPLEKWEEFRRQAMVSGNLEAAEIASDNISELREMEAGESEDTLTTIDGQTFRVRQKDDGSLEIRDPFTGEIVDERPAQPVDDKKRLDRINQLADDFRSEASDAQDVANAVAIGLDAPANAAGDVTLLTMLTRAIDPGVSVREADIKRGETIGGMSAKAKAMVNKVASGGEMSEEQREFIRSEIRRVGQTQHEQFAPTLQRYAKRARDAGVDPRLVVFDPFAPIFGNGAGGSGAGGPGGSSDAGNPFAGPPPGHGGN